MVVNSLLQYVDDLLLASIDVGSPHETKQILLKTFEKKDFRERHLYSTYRFIENILWYV